MSKKKILFIGHQAESVGGAEDDLERLLKFTYQSQEFENTLLIPEGPRVKQYGMFADKVITYKIGYLPGLYTNILDYFKYLLKILIQFFDIIRKIKNTRQYNICVVNVTVLVMPAVFIKLLNRKIKTIFFIREMIKPNFIRKIVFKIISKISSGVIFVSEGLKTDYINYAGDSKNSIVMYSASEPSDFFESDKAIEYVRNFFERNFFVENTRIILNIGPVSPIKNQKLIIESLKNIILLNPGIRPVFLHLGRIEPNFFYAKELLKLIKEQGLEKNVLFLNALDKETTQEFIKKSDVVVISSISEGFPLVVSEAFMNETVLITTDCISNERILENNYNCIIIKNDISELSEAITKIFQNEKLRLALIKNALKTADEFLNLERNMNFFIKYLQVV
ncbi:MAG: glycosyltransferase [Bacteroidetes bacterium]|nr:glycosyltransferase [Bacteroidota bacterium]